MSDSDWSEAIAAGLRFDVATHSGCWIWRGTLSCGRLPRHWDRQRGRVGNTRRAVVADSGVCLDGARVLRCPHSKRCCNPAHLTVAPLGGTRE